MKVVNMRVQEGRVQEPLRPPLQFRYPHSVPILVPMVLDRSHNLRMIHERLGTFKLSGPTRAAAEWVPGTSEGMSAGSQNRAYSGLFLY